MFEKQKDKHLVATRKHIGRLFQKYSFPLHFLNLTKANNNREETVAAQYRKFVTFELNKELPKNLKVTFVHYDVKSKKIMEKKKEVAFPSELFAHAREMLSTTNFFSCVPLSLTEECSKNRD